MNLDGNKKRIIKLFEWDCSLAPKVNNARPDHWEGFVGAAENHSFSNRNLIAAKLSASLLSHLEKSVELSSRYVTCTRKDHDGLRCVVRIVQESRPVPLSLRWNLQSFVRSLDKSHEMQQMKKGDGPHVILRPDVTRLEERSIDTFSQKQSIGRKKTKDTFFAWNRSRVLEHIWKLAALLKHRNKIRLLVLPVQHPNCAMAKRFASSVCRDLRQVFYIQGAGPENAAKTYEG